MGAWKDLAAEIAAAIATDPEHGGTFDEILDLLLDGGVELANLGTSGRVWVCSERRGDGHLNTTDERNDIALMLTLESGMGLVAREIGAPRWTTVRAVRELV